MRTKIRTWAALAVAVLLSQAAEAKQVTFPIQLDHAFVRQLLVQQLFAGKNETAVVWRDDQGCTELLLSKPEVSAAGSDLKVAAKFDGKLGAGVGQLCLGVSPRTGFVEFTLRPEIRPGNGVVDFRVIDSHVLGADRKKQFSGKIWDWVKEQVHSYMDAFRVDLRRPLNELQIVLPMFLPQEDVDRTQRLLDSIRLQKVEATADALVVTVGMEIEAAGGPAAEPTPEPTLTIEEVQRWESAWQSWDAFLTFVIKRAGRDALSADVADSLRQILLEARYDLLPALRPASAGQPDPVRPLFLRTWRRLAPVLRQLSTGVPGEGAIRYLSFVAAADALAALDELGPEFGFEISAAGLRRLARTIDPGAIDDPTRYSEDVDPELREMFGFGEPPPLPEVPASDAAESEPTADEAVVVDPDAVGGPTATPETPPPGAATTVDSPTPAVATPTPEPLPDEFVDPPPRPAAPQSSSADGFWRVARSLRLVSPALASVDPNEQEFKKLYRWVPKRNELPDYLSLVRRVLIQARDKTRGKVGKEFLEVYDNLVLTTAWQETCWRQFVRVGKTIDTIASPVGAVGIMQVNAKVWRGFYDVEALRGDIAYNAVAGSEIARHYFLDYAVKKGEHTTTGNLDNLARATYSAYNAGPGGLARYRKPKSKEGVKIDTHFWEKYQQVKAGKEMSVLSCYGT